MECMTRSTPEAQGPLQERRRPGVVAGAERPRRLRDGGHGREIGDGDGRVGGRLRPDQARASGRMAARTAARSVMSTNETLEAPGHEVLAQQLGRPEVRVQRRHHVVARRQGLEDGHGRGHARGEGDGGRAPFELRQGRFQRAPVGIGVTDVGVPGRERNRRATRSNVVRQVEGGHDGARHRIGGGSRVHGQGLEPQLGALLSRTLDPPTVSPSVKTGGPCKAAGAWHTVRAMTLTRREALQAAGAAALAPIASSLHAQPSSAPAPARPRIGLAVSTYSYWHFKTEKYPIEKVIDSAASLGFDGVEILHRQMESETPAYVSGLKKAAFRNGLDLVMLSIHQDFVSPDAAERQEGHRPHDPLHRARRATSGIPAMRLNSGAGTPSSPSTTS